jgi:adenylylsulfate kinase
MDPADPAAHQGFVAWLEGLPGSGKTTLGRGVADQLRSRGWKVEVLDGDEVRGTLSPELGYSRRDRETHARRVSYVATVLARHGVAVIVSLITPYETSREAARAEVRVPFEEIWVKCPLEVCRQRDPKGLYRKTEEGSVTRFTGVDDPFEEPLNPDLVVDTSTSDVPTTTRRIVAHLETRKLISAA